MGSTLLQAEMQSTAVARQSAAAERYVSGLRIKDKVKQISVYLINFAEVCVCRTDAGAGPDEQI